MSRTLKYEIPGIDWRRNPSDLDPDDALTLFRPECEGKEGFVIEIGFGRGEFLLELASARPNTAFLGIEISFKRVLKMARKVARAQLTNVRLIEARAEALFDGLIPEACADEVWINFSDPWPKDRHARRRVIQPTFVASATRCLRPEGRLEVATDDIPYAEQIEEVLNGEPRLRNAHAPYGWVEEVPGRPKTGYEVDWRAQGRRLHFFTYVRDEGASIAAVAGGRK